MTASRFTTGLARRNKGFTLVEILIVVIILGILAAIVIPQFTNASEDARKSSLTSQLQTIRSQVELYKLQHRDQYPTIGGTLATAWDWDKMTTRTNEDGEEFEAGDVGPFGPYLQGPPKNPLTGKDEMMISTSDDLDLTATLTFGNNGWIITNSGKIYTSNKAGDKVYNEANPSAN